MARINPKLNLNKTPQNVENSSLLFSKNIKLLPDLSIAPDNSLNDAPHELNDSIIENSNIVGKIVGVNNKIYYFVNRCIDTRDKWKKSGGYITKYGSLGNPCIDLDNYYPTNNTTFDAKFDFLRNSTVYLFGSRHILNDTIKQVFTLLRSMQTITIYLGGVTRSILNTDLVKGPYYISLFKIDNEYFLRLNDSDYTTVPSVPEFTSQYKLQLFNFYNNGSTPVNQSAYLKFYHFKLYDNGTLIKDLWPAVDDNNVACMYDYVSNEFVYNAETGSFKVSQEVLDAAAITEQYINESAIYEYDELTKTVKKVDCSWTYKGGEITGCVSINNTNEEILTVCEYNTTDKVPIKHINLAKCSSNDDESIYTQNPNIPITNILLDDYYPNKIPNGVYQFFLRYKIREDFYTDWFPASRELFSGNNTTISTVQGSLKYVELNDDSNESFIFVVEHLFPEYCNIYPEFQLGFILSNNDGIFARSWKHFNINTSSIYFDYNSNDVEEINIDDLLKTSFEIFNVGNAINYKNKLYISNFEETDFNKDIINNINVTIVNKKISNNAVNETYFNNKLLRESTASQGYYDIIGTGDRPNIGNIYGISPYCITSAEEIDDTTFDTNDYRIIRHADNVWTWTERTVTLNRVILSNQSIYTDGYVICGIYIKSGSTIYSIRGLYDGKDHAISTTDTPDCEEYFDSGDSAMFINGVVFTEEEVITQADSLVRRAIRGITTTTPTFELYVVNSNTPITSTEYYVVYSKATFVENHIELVKVNGVDYRKIYSDVTKEIKCIKRECIVNQALITTSSSSDLLKSNYTKYTSLVPFTTYDFYIHYVKQNGVVTNGIYVGSKKVIPHGTETVDTVVVSDKGNYMYYPQFSGIDKIDGYVAAFFSIVKTEDNIAECLYLDVEHIQEDNLDVYKHKLDCLELDTLLYNLNDNITIVTHNSNSSSYRDNEEIVANNSKYYSSSYNINGELSHFGERGYIEFDKASQQSDKYVYYVRIPYNNKNNTKNQLIKVTPFIKLYDSNDGPQTSKHGYNNLYDLNIPGYFCKVTKPNNSGHVFVAGNDIYDKATDSNNLEIKTGLVSVINSNSYFIHSNFNLNYLSLLENISDKLRSYTDTDSNTTKYQSVKTIESQNLSYVYTLDKMYRDYTRKLYSSKDNNKITRFENTVRSSNIDTDEVYRNIFKFEATDYYNIPTSRGVIVNLFSIVNKIYVHSQNGLFVFTDANMMKVGDNLYASNMKDIALRESNPFDIGVQEVFDDAYGYAGLSDKKHSLVTFNSYIFYDKIANVIYAYGGDANISPISDSIFKLLTWFKPEDILFAADNENKRFFINLRRTVNSNTENICLSYSFVSKSFVSVHDMDFDEAFNSRIHTYFIKHNFTTVMQETVRNSKVYVISDNKDLTINNYNDLKKLSKLYLNDSDSIYLNNVPTVVNCIDILCNTAYETVKTLNWINWICEKITNYGTNHDINVAEEQNDKYSGTKLRIYSDQTYTDLIPLSVYVEGIGEVPLIANDHHLMSGSNVNAKTYTYPRYNCGVWSLNNFRDIKNYARYLKYNASLVSEVQALYPNATISQDADGYFTKTERGVTSRVVNPKNYSDSDNKSLIYGKYFVARFIFKDTNFKFENITFNMGDYEKV